MAEKLPFTFTPNIVRYIRQVLDLYEKRSQGSIKGQALVPFSIMYEGYERGEPFMSHSETMRENFLDYLGDAINYDVSFEGEPALYDDKLDSPFVSSSPSGWKEGTYGPQVENFGITVKDIRPFQKLWKIHSSKKAPAKPMLRDEVITSQIHFDPKARVLSHGSHIHKFQSGRDGRSSKFPLFVHLWKARRHEVNGQVLQGCSGLPAPVNFIGREIGFALEKKQFYKLEHNLREDGFDITISFENDKALMTVKE